MPPLARVAQFAFLRMSTEVYTPVPPVLADGAQPDSVPLMVTFWFPVDVELSPGDNVIVPFTVLQLWTAAALAGAIPPPNIPAATAMTNPTRTSRRYTTSSSRPKAFVADRLPARLRPVNHGFQCRGQARYDGLGALGPERQRT